MYYPPTYHPGYTMVHTVPTVPHILPLMMLGCVATKPWAQIGNNPWVERYNSAHSPHPVMVRRELCA